MGCLLSAALSAALSVLAPWDLGAPVAPSDLARFPFDAEACRENWELASAHRRWLADAYGAEGAAVLRPDLLGAYGGSWPTEWRRRAALCESAWDSLDNAWRSFEWGDVGTPEHARVVARHLAKLRAAIGPEMYAAGAMPPPVPYEFFRELP
jgi:hypothetical protein